MEDIEGKKMSPDHFLIKALFEFMSSDESLTEIMTSHLVKN